MKTFQFFPLRNFRNMARMLVKLEQCNGNEHCCKNKIKTVETLQKKEHLIKPDDLRKVLTKINKFGVI